MTITAAALLVTGPALAGGFTPAAVTPAPSAPVLVPGPVVTPAPVVTSDWSGAYVGGQIGFGRLSTDATLPSGSEDNDIADGEGALFGVHAGYMRDFGRIVAGAELDWDKAQIGVSDTSIEDAPEFAQIDSVARAKLRLGFDAGRVLPYVTAGLTRAFIDFDEEVTTAPFEETYNGHLFGAGVLVVVNENLMVGVEALRHTFDDAPTFEDPADGGDVEFDSVVDTLTLRGSFRF